MQQPTSTKKYLWLYHDYTLDNGTTVNTTPANVYTYSSSKSVSSVTKQYYLSTSSSSATGGSWGTTLTAKSGKYNWTRDYLSFSSGSPSYTTAAYSSALTNICAEQKTAEFTDDGINLYGGGIKRSSVDSDGLHIYNSTGDELSSFTISGAKLGAASGSLYYTLANQGELDFYYGTTKKAMIEYFLTNHLDIYCADAPVRIRANTEIGTSTAEKGLTVTGSLAAGNIDCGDVSITPSAANTPTSKAVSFNKTFSSAPNVVVSIQANAPGTVVTGCAATNISTTGFTAWVTRTNTTATTLNWIAIGS